MYRDTHDYISESLQTLQEGLTPIMERQLQSRFGDAWPKVVTGRLENPAAWDSHGFLRIMNIFWKDAFGHLRPPARAYVNEAIDARNRWARRDIFSREDADRALDTMRRLLEAAGNREDAERIQTLRKELMPTEVDKAAARPIRVLRDLSAPTPKPSLPVPLAKRRYRRRTRKLTVKQLACDLLCETIDIDGQQFGLPFDEILEKVREQLPDAKTSINSLNCYTSQIRQVKHGFDQWEGRLPAMRLAD